MKLVPLSDRVVLKQLEAEETTKSGIILTSAAQEKPQDAEVVAVGPGGVVDGKEVKMQVKEGQKVIYSKYAGTEVKLEDEEFISRFKFHSAAKSVHHGFVGGLLEHTLGVTKLCDYYCTAYPVLNRDLLLTAAMCHDIGKIKEISPFPENDYTDDGQLLGHIVMGAQMVGEKAAGIEGFPHGLLSELQHCILAHHGKYEYGSPKVPALIEAMALNYADDTDAKMETFKEILENNSDNNGWFGYNRLMESNLRSTRG